MVQGFGDLDEHRSAQRAGTVQTILFSGGKAFRRLFVEDSWVGVVGLREDLTFGIAHSVCQVFLVRNAKGGDVLFLTELFPVADFQNSQGQDALRGLFKCAVERFVQLMLHHQPGADSRSHPEQRHAQGQPQRETFLQT